MPPLSRRTLLAASALTLAGSVAAQTASTRRPMLVIEGAIRKGQPSGDGLLRLSLSEEQVLALPTRRIVTVTDWRARTDYVGPTLATVLNAAGVEPTDSTRIQLHALNDYSVSVPGSDLRRYDPVLAHTVGGQRLTARDFGPLWLMYPREDHEELLRNATSNGKLIWQVRRIVVY